MPRKESGASRERALREHVVRLLSWEDAHASLETVAKRFPAALRGKRPRGLAHSAWELLEHLRLAQRDILEFCTGPGEERAWPDDDWPASAAPPDARAWSRSLSACLADRDALVALARDPASDLLAPLPHARDKTLLRELLLAADHNAWHTGQLMLLRRLLGA